jgi:glycosyltransferase XagB
VGPAAFWAMQAMTMGVFLSALLHPFALALIIWPFISGSGLAIPESLLDTGLAGLSLAVLAAGYGVSMAAGIAGLRRLHYHGWWFTIATLPAYWLLMSVAAWMGLWQFIVAPFHWNKTHHGLSSQQRRRKVVPR